MALELVFQSKAATGASVQLDIVVTSYGEG